MVPSEDMSDRNDLAAPVLSAPPGWLEVIDDTHRLTQLEADWDGEGAQPVPPPLIRSAVALFEALRNNGRAVPDGVYPLPSGAIMVEWHNEDGSRLSAEIRQPGRAKMMHWYPNGGPAEFRCVSFLESSESAAPAGHLQVASAFENYSWPQSH